MSQKGQQPDSDQRRRVKLKRKIRTRANPERGLAREDKRNVSELIEEDSSDLEPEQQQANRRRSGSNKPTAREDEFSGSQSNRSVSFRLPSRSPERRGSRPDSSHDRKERDRGSGWVRQGAPRRAVSPRTRPTREELYANEWGFEDRSEEYEDERDRGTPKTSWNATSDDGRRRSRSQPRGPGLVLLNIKKKEAELRRKERQLEARESQVRAKKGRVRDKLREVNERARELRDIEEKATGRSREGMRVFSTFDAAYRRGVELYNDGQWEASAEQLEVAMDEMENAPAGANIVIDPLLYEYLSYAYHQEGQHHLAIALAEKALVHKPGDEQLRRNIKWYRRFLREETERRRSAPQSQGSRAAASGPRADDEYA